MLGINGPIATRAESRDAGLVCLALLVLVLLVCAVYYTNKAVGKLAPAAPAPTFSAPCHCPPAPKRSVAPVIIVCPNCHLRMSVKMPATGDVGATVEAVDD